MRDAGGPGALLTWYGEKHACSWKISYASKRAETSVCGKIGYMCLEREKIKCKEESLNTRTLPHPRSKRDGVTSVKRSIYPM